jgi:hypothetical protein
MMFVLFLQVKLVRVNKRIQEAYCAELYLTKTEDPTDSITFDLRPSDAINIAVRCRVYLLFLLKVLLDANSLSSLTFAVLALLFVSIVAFLLILDQLDYTSESGLSIFLINNNVSPMSLVH